MNPLANQFYSVGSEANFQEVLFLSEDKDVDWEELSERVPDLPRGWFELSRVSCSERIEFVCDFWLDRLPFLPMAHSALFHFFSGLDDIAIVIVKKEGQWQPEMVYSLADGSTFFRGWPPAIDEDVRIFKNEMGLALPRDYLAFLHLHNGFGKLSEMGLLCMEDVGRARQRVREILWTVDQEILWDGRIVDPEDMIPFYEDYGLNSFQCFFSDWYPNSEMGNVYLSGINYTISDTSDRRNWAEAKAFPSFLEWLVDYLEGMSVSL